jgi:hypothetical protein
MDPFSIRPSEAERLSHPGHRLDIGPKDFIALGPIKGQMSDCICKSHQNLLKTGAEIFNQIDKAMLISVFESWIKRLQWVIEHKRTN